MAKLCLRCNEVKPESEFYLNSHTGNPTSPCKTCHKARTLAWQSKNKQKVRDAVNRWRRKNLHVKNALAKAFAKRYPEKLNARSAERRAMKKSRVAPWSDKNKIAEIYAAARRMTVETGIVHDVDHIVPLKSRLVSGLHVENNLQILPHKLNRSKGNRVWPDMP